jgi:tetratricopeptide (TPR) repeat protein
MCILMRRTLLASGVISIMMLCAGHARGQGAGTAPVSEGGASAVVMYATIEDAISAIKRPGAVLSAEQIAEAARVIDAANEAGEAEHRVKYARALLAARQQDFAGARNLMREVVALQPDDAAYRMTHAGHAFMSISKAGTLDKMSLAEEGRDAYLQALRIDNTLIEPRIGLAEFYIQAPGIVGGSWKKAGEQAQALLDLPDGRGEFFGYTMKARIAMERERWTEMSDHFTKAETARGESASAFVAIVAHANALLDKKEDAKTALVQAERALAIAAAEDYTALAVVGRCKQELKDWRGAADAFAAVLERKADAKISRLGYATSLEKLGRQAEALQQYREFVARFGNDALAEQANAGIARLNRAGVR